MLVENIICPYCKHDNSFDIDIQKNSNRNLPLKIVYCEGDDGGCNREFILKSKLKIYVSTLKIEPV